MKNPDFISDPQLPIELETYQTDKLFSVGLALIIFLSVSIYTSRACYLFDRLGCSAFDLGIFDQAVWLISRGQTPFVTIRGLHIFSDHFSAGLYLVAPLYWVAPHPKTLLFFQALTLGLGAIPVYCIALHLIVKRSSALAYSLLYLLYSPIQFGALQEYHPETICAPLMLCVFLALLKQKWIPYFICLILIASMKETVGISIILLGAYGLSVNRMSGALTVLFGAVALFVSLYTIAIFRHSWQNPYSILYREFGGTWSEIIVRLATHPELILHHIASLHSARYLALLLLPFLCTSIFAPEILLLALPSLLMNLLSSRLSMVSGISYYDVLSGPFIIIASIYGYRRISARTAPYIQETLLASMLVASCVCVIYSSSHSTKLSDLSREDRLRLSLSIIPKATSVSATSSACTFLAHRKMLYLFPNPFVVKAYGATSQAIREIESMEDTTASVDKFVEGMQNSKIEYVVICPAMHVFPISPQSVDQLATEMLKNRRLWSGLRGRGNDLPQTWS